MIEINSAVIEEWKSRLVSGKYNQCRGVLKNEHGEYCSLGVLAEVVYGDDCFKEGKCEYLTVPGHTSESYLPKDLSVKLEELTGLEPRDFVHMNDIENKTFKEIAACLD